MNGEPGLDMVEHLVGEADSGEHLADAVSDLAQRDPKQARHVIESVTASLDEATEGKHTKELEKLEAAALEALGLDARHLVAAAGNGPATPPEN